MSWKLIHKDSINNKPVSGWVSEWVIKFNSFSGDSIGADNGLVLNR